MDRDFRRYYIWALLDLKDALDDYLFGYHRDPRDRELLSYRVRLQVDEVERAKKELEWGLQIANSSFVNADELEEVTKSLLEKYKDTCAAPKRRSLRARKSPERLIYRM